MSLSSSEAEYAVDSISGTSGQRCAEGNGKNGARESLSVGSGSRAYPCCPPRHCASRTPAGAADRSP